MIKDSKYVKINSINPLYLIINKVNGYYEEINGNKYLTLVRSYDEKYMKIKFNSDDHLPLNKLIKIHNATIVVRAVFMKIKNVICKFS